MTYACPWVSEERGKHLSCKLQILQERTCKIKEQNNHIPSPTPCLMSQGTWQNMAYSLPLVPLYMGGQWADREGPLRCLIRLLHCSISHFKQQSTLSNIYHRTDSILELIHPICSGQPPPESNDVRDGQVHTAEGSSCVTTEDSVSEHRPSIKVGTAVPASCCVRPCCEAAMQPEKMLISPSHLERLWD